MQFVENSWILAFLGRELYPRKVSDPLHQKSDIPPAIREAV
jgi:hypothetical protein